MKAACSADVWTTPCGHQTRMCSGLHQWPAGICATGFAGPVISCPRATNQPAVLAAFCKFAAGSRSQRLRMPENVWFLLFLAKRRRRWWLLTGPTSTAAPIRSRWLAMCPHVPTYAFVPARLLVWTSAHNVSVAIRWSWPHQAREREAQWAIAADGPREISLGWRAHAPSLQR